jgi:hypothetical protein
VIRGTATEFRYERGVQPAPKLGEWVEVLTAILEKEARLPRRERRSTQRLFEELRGRGYGGAHDSVHRFAEAWRNERARVPVQAFVPLSFAPGEAYQFDWSHETITLQGLPLTIKAAHMKLSHSRMPFVRAYFRETQELVFDARAAGRMVLVRSHAERIVVLFNDTVVADHPRQFRRDQIVDDPWHYLPVLVRKPGALRNGAPFKDWDLPAGLARVRARLQSHADADRQFVKVLGAVLEHGLAAVETACAEALEAGIASGDVILTVLARRRQPPPPPSITTPDALRLKIEPAANCGRYDSIRKVA